MPACSPAPSGSVSLNFRISPGLLAEQLAIELGAELAGSDGVQVVRTRRLGELLAADHRADVGDDVVVVRRGPGHGLELGEALACSLDEFVNLLVGRRRRWAFDLDSLVVLQGEARPDLDLGGEGERLALLDAVERDVGVGDRREVVLAHRVAVVDGHRVGQELLHHGVAADLRVDHLARRFALAEAGHANLLGDLSIRLLDVLLDVGLGDLDREFDLVFVGRFDGGSHRGERSGNASERPRRRHRSRARAAGRLLPVFDGELAFANELADEAAEIALSFFRGEFEVHIKPDHTPVTEADLAVERMVRDRLAERYPKDAVRGEEGGLSGDAPRTWIVDPIDGTQNFAGGIPIWGTLLALQSGDELVMGVASAPALGERYAAASGLGATCNGREIHVSGAATIEDSMLAYGDAERWMAGADARPGFLELFRRARRTRGFGDFWGHMLVARGAVEIMVEPELAVWDYAALAVIAREAGGRVTQADGSPLAHDGSCLTTNGAVHDEVVGLLQGRIARPDPRRVRPKLRPLLPCETDGTRRTLTRSQLPPADPRARSSPGSNLRNARA